MSKEKFEELAGKIRTKGSPCGGWMTQADCYWLAAWLPELDLGESPVIMELGVFQGGSSTIFLEAQPTCKFHALDNWKGGPPSPPYKNIKDAFLVFMKPYMDRIQMHSGDSIVIGKQWDTPMDICYIDGCHDGQYPREDIFNFGRWVKIGGYLLVDDFQMGPVRGAIEQLLTHNPKWVEVRIPSRDGGEIAVFQRIKAEGDYEVPR